MRLLSLFLEHKEGEHVQGFLMLRSIVIILASMHSAIFNQKEEEEAS